MKNLFCVVVLILSVSNLNAGIMWHWSFGSNEGLFSTDGVTANAGSYSISDFSVISSGEGATIGSWSGGQYNDSGFDTTSEYSFVWDGSNVTQWLHSGANLFDWIVFEDLSTSKYFLFGWETDNINTENQAAYFDNDANVRENIESSLLSITLPVPVNVPEPTPLMIIVLGIAGTLLSKRKKPI